MKSFGIGFICDWAFMNSKHPKLSVFEVSMSACGCGCKRSDFKIIIFGLGVGLIMELK